MNITTSLNRLRKAASHLRGKQGTEVRKVRVDDLRNLLRAYDALAENASAATDGKVD